ncbi:MAG: hypothetical protein E7632_12390 [Ruminococcaceae bacterium]|nr:hypothetical protein [Oscillospiraceae bacterium]
MRRPTRAAYIALSLTWGAPLTLAGALTFAVLMAAGKRPKRFGYCWYIEVGENWGGLEFGLFFLTCKNPSLHLCAHEHGHGLQNILWGPLMPMVITIPSAIRWHWRHLSEALGHPPKKPYDAIWFEGQATKWGMNLFGNQ